MTKLLHSRSKIFFPDPYVLRVEFSSDQTFDKSQADYRKMVRSAYKLINGTWGFCPLEPELTKIKDDHKQVAPPGPNHFAGLSHNAVLSVLFDPDYVNIVRGYLCFKDELDALQFRLSIDTTSRQVHLWPERWFTIHEVVESNE